MNCKPKPSHGNEGVVGLTRWMEKMEFVFEISLCTKVCKVKFTASTLEDVVLCWWTSYTRTMGVNLANAMSWSELKQLMIQEYYPREEIQKLD